MSNKLWVKWNKSSDGGSSEEYYWDKAIGLADDAIICDLRRAFVQQQHLQIDSAAVNVHEEEGQTKLEEDATLKLYFIDSGDSENDKKQPGKSKASALFLTLLPPPQRLSSFEGHGNRPPLLPPQPSSEFTELRRRIAAIEMQDSRAVSYADYFKESDLY
jgi:hypothetical protein